MRTALPIPSSHREAQQGSSSSASLSLPPSITNEHEDEEEECELVIINNLSKPIWLCWISPDNQLLSYRKVNDCSIPDKSVSNQHVEDTYVSHRFLCLRDCENKPTRLEEVSENLFLCQYTIKKGKWRHVINISEDNQNKHTNLFSSWIKKKNKNKKRKHDDDDGNGDVKIDLSYTSLEGQDMIDHSKKIYEEMSCCGFQLYYEPDIFQSYPTLQSILIEDFTMITYLLPSQACQKLQHSTPVWFNKSLFYGPRSSPIDEKKGMYHPMDGGLWLKKNGFNLRKAGCIEICNAEDYITTRNLWGPGGLLLHEYCHAYHDKFCPNGYDCEDILDAYRLAMKEKLYESVSCHSLQGKRTQVKHYACANQMEFFAELSVAFHWKLDENSEYNKWFPHNYQQLLSHDPMTCAVLELMWNP
eukprot:gene4926-5408_t